jgi:hypothetical protein|tara:strand:+ start:3290 stop:3541 length:252 start_codon:yes stop_codon:yes gene_type:complete
MTNDIKKIIFLFLGFWVVIGFGGFLVWNLNKAEWDSQNQQKIKELRIDKLERKLKKCRIKNKNEIELYGYAEDCRKIQNQINY